jgi:phosphoribosylformylglycinamidine synthase
LTRDELGGSHWVLVNDLIGGNVPQVDATLAKSIFVQLHTAIKSGTVRSCHDLSEGGLAVALAEMCFAGGFGASISLDDVPHHVEPGLLDLDIIKLFSESNSRFLCEVTPENVVSFEAALHGLPFAKLGVVTADKQLTITSSEQSIVTKLIDALYDAWKTPLDF